MRNILITGANDFIGESLSSYLIENLKESNIIELNDYKISNTNLLKYLKKADFILHLKEVVYSKNKLDYQLVNVEFTKKLLQALINCKSNAPILFLSSQQALSRSDYGQSKFAAERLFIEYNKLTKVPVCIYRLPEVFGIGAKPNNNSIIATYCYNITHGLDLNLKGKEKSEDMLKFVNITDVVDEFTRAICGYPNMVLDSCFATVPKPYVITRKELIKKIKAFSEIRDTNTMPSFACRFDQHLYSTFLSYIDINNLSYKLKVREKDKVQLVNFINSYEQGQTCFFKLKKSKTLKSNHAIIQKYLVVDGEAVIKVKKKRTGEYFEYVVSGENPTVVDIPPDCAHDMTNIGDKDVIVIKWSNKILQK